jgi:hypothetical protein
MIRECLFQRRMKNSKAIPPSFLYDSDPRASSDPEGDSKVSDPIMFSKDHANGPLGHRRGSDPAKRYRMRVFPGGSSSPSLSRGRRQLRLSSCLMGNFVFDAIGHGICICDTGILGRTGGDGTVRFALGSVVHGRVTEISDIGAGSYCILPR